MDPRPQKLENRFKQIGDEHMRDLPIYHKALNVEATAFQPIDAGLLGLLITPWFMNITLLPDDPTAYAKHEVGAKVTLPIAGTDQEFLVNTDDELGPYLFRSVASPMLGYANQDLARADGLKALAKLLDENPDTA